MKRLLYISVMTALLLILAAPALASTITLPQSTTVIESEAFMGNTSITEVIVPEGTLSIGDNAFAGCTGLKKITIPGSATTIGEDAFSGCSSDLSFDCPVDSVAYAYALRNGINVNSIVYRALIIGQSYAGTDISQLYGTINDANALSFALQQYNGTPYRITRINDLTANGILSSITSALADADENDVSLFYYSGHGYRTGALVGTDRNLVSPLALRTRLDTISGKKIVLIDSCYSGSMIGKSISMDGTSADEFTSAFMSAFTARARSASDLADNNYYVITASNKSQLSWESGRCGLFTLGLTKALGWDENTNTAYPKAYADADSNGKISLDEAYVYTKAQINLHAASIGTEQSSQVYPENCTDFYIVQK